MKLPRLLWFAAAATTLFVSNVAFANTRICVTVQQKSWYKPGSSPGAAPAAAPAPAPIDPEPQPMLGPAPSVSVERTEGEADGPAANQEAPLRRARPRANPHEIDPTLHLRRMLEYEVTHEPGFAAVDERCEQRLTVELYQLESGWTVFGALLGHGARGEGGPRGAGRVRGARAAPGVRAAPQQADQPHHHARERAARRQRDEPAHDQRHRPPGVRHGHGDARREPAHRPGPDRGGRQRAAHPDSRQHPDWLPPQAARLGPRRLRPPEPRHREHGRPQQRSRRARRLRAGASWSACTSSTTPTRPGSTRSTSAAARPSRSRSSTSSGRWTFATRARATRWWAAG